MKAKVLSESMFAPSDLLFVLTRDLMEFMEGDLVAAVVLARVHFRTKIEPDGWWQASVPMLAADLVLGENRVKAALKRLLAAGLLEGEQRGGNTTRAMSYRVIVDEGAACPK